MSGAMMMVMVPIILVIFLISAVSSCSYNTYHEENRYPDVSVQEDIYDEEELQDYADKQYRLVFGETATYEDNLLLVILTEEDHASFSYIAWVGDHIATDINLLFGNEETKLGEILEKCVNETNYEYSLDSNLADAMQMMTTEIKHLNLESSFECEEERAAFDSRLVNHSDLPMTEETVNTALADFTEQTGIPVVIVVEDASEVFSKATETDETAIPNPTTQNWSIQTIIMAVGVVLLLVVLIIALVSRKKDSDSQQESRYSDFDDQYK